MDAKCQCGQLSAKLAGPVRPVVACHCTDCQRRSGSPFSALAFYPVGSVEVSGNATRYERVAASGNTVETFFCPECGSTVYLRASRAPHLVGVTVGTICDPAYPAPIRSLWEQDKHDWIAIPEPAQHFAQDLVREPKSG